MPNMPPIIINYCSFYIGGDANGDCQLYGSGDIRKCKDINCHYKETENKEIVQLILNTYIKNPVLHQLYFSILYEQKFVNINYDDCNKIASFILKVLEKKGSGGEKGSLNERENVVSDSKYLSHEDDSKLPEWYFKQEYECKFEPKTEPKPSMVCGDGPEPEKPLHSWDDMKSVIEKAEQKLISEFLKDLRDSYVYWTSSLGYNKLKEKWQGRLKE